jgi:hypothetical protein
LPGAPEYRFEGPVRLTSEDENQEDLCPIVQVADTRSADVRAWQSAAKYLQRQRAAGEQIMAGSLVEFSNEIADSVERAGAFVVSLPEGGREGVNVVRYSASPPQYTRSAFA